LAFENGSEKRNMKKYYVIIGLLLTVISIVIWIKFGSNFDVAEQASKTDQKIDQALQELNASKANLNKTQRVINETSRIVENLTLNQNTSLSNQKVIAKGLNDLGSIVIGKVSNIEEQTKKIDDIKFNTEKILNKSDANITLYNPDITKSGVKK
jgi:predicted PurR-regulated permease PerM